MSWVNWAGAVVEFAAKFAATTKNEITILFMFTFNPVCREVHLLSPLNSHDHRAYRGSRIF
jgi:hypothetical protein